MALGCKQTTTKQRWHPRRAKKPDLLITVCGTQVHQGNIWVPMTRIHPWETTGKERTREHVELDVSGGSDVTHLLTNNELAANCIPQMDVFIMHDQHRSKTPLAFWPWFFAPWETGSWLAQVGILVDRSRLRRSQFKIWVLQGGVKTEEVGRGRRGAERDGAKNGRATRPWIGRAGLRSCRSSGSLTIVPFYFKHIRWASTPACSWSCMFVKGFLIADLTDTTFPAQSIEAVQIRCSRAKRRRSIDGTTSRKMSVAAEE